ncbi:MAG: hypothetical protein NTY38_00145 [Acidobacteria bacterium]|nr:hypothetical protein [Acidobacteriota bacterium]
MINIADALPDSNRIIIEDAKQIRSLREHAFDDFFRSALQGEGRRALVRRE